MPKKPKAALTIPLEEHVYFLRKEQPSVSRALPPVGWQRTVVHPWQMTTVWAWEKTVVMVKQPGHLTSMKKERGAGTRAYLKPCPCQFLDDVHSSVYIIRGVKVVRTLSLCLRASEAGLGLRRSTARTWGREKEVSMVFIKIRVSKAVRHRVCHRGLVWGFQIHRRLFILESSPVVGAVVPIE